MIQRKIEKGIMNDPIKSREYDRGLKETSVLGGYFYIADIIHAVSPIEGKILDIGSGTSLLDIELAIRLPDLEFHCIELSSSMVKIAKENINYYDKLTNFKFELSKRIKVIQEDIYNINGSYSLIISTFLLHHLQSKDDAINIMKKMKNLMKKDASLVILDFIHPRTSFEKKLVKNVFTRGFRKQFKKGFDNSLDAAFSEEDLKDLFNKAGLINLRFFFSKPLKVFFIVINKLPQFGIKSKTPLYKNSNLQQKIRYYLTKLIAIYSGLK